MTTVVDSVGSVGDTAIAVRAQALGKRYRSKWALRECTFDLPEAGWRHWSARTAPARRR